MTGCGIEVGQECADGQAAANKAMFPAVPAGYAQLEISRARSTSRSGSHRCRMDSVSRARHCAASNCPTETARI